MNTTTPSAPGRLSFVLGYPLFLLSRGFYRTVRSVMRRLQRAKRYDPQKISWQVLEERLANPLALPYVMVNGPRWNTHAVVATLGPLEVEESLSIRLDPALAVRPEWFFVLYRMPENRTVAWQGPHGPEPVQDARIEFRVAPGTYAIAARFYGAPDAVTMPEVEIDGGARLLAGRTVSQEDVSPARGVYGKRSRFYDALHHHVYFAMRHRRFFSPEYLRSEYLPVGNPETEFLFGSFDRGSSLEIEFDDSVREQYSVYCTCYNRSSFPVHSGRVAGFAGERTPRLDENGTYLLRLVPRSAVPVEAPPLAERVQVRQVAARAAEVELLAPQTS